jgi:hypothetical protein
MAYNCCICLSILVVPALHLHIKDVQLMCLKEGRSVKQNIFDVLRCRSGSGRCEKVGGWRRGPGRPPAPLVQ